MPICNAVVASRRHRGSMPAPFGSAATMSFDRRLGTRWRTGFNTEVAWEVLLIEDSGDPSLALPETTRPIVVGGEALPASEALLGTLVLERAELTPGLGFPDGDCAASGSAVERRRNPRAGSELDGVSMG